MTTLAGPPREDHAVHRKRLLDHAERMVRAGDRLQASEKVWGAVAHTLKEVADGRGWPYNNHGDAVVITGYVADQVKNDEIRFLYAVVSNLHRNFYLDVYPMEEIAAGLRGGRRLVELLLHAHQTMPPDLEMPTDRVYRRRARRPAVL